MELVNKFDNALAGVAGDGGTTGVVVNDGNKLETGQFWQMQPVRRPQPRPGPRRSPRRPALDRDALAGNILARFCPAGHRAGLPAGAALQHARPDRAGRAPGRAHDRQGHDHRPRPHERAARASSCSTIVEAAALLGRRLEPHLEHARRDPAHLQARRRSSRRTRAARRTSSTQWQRAAGRARPALLLGHRLGRGHERLRPQGGPRNGAEPGHLPVQVLRRQGRRSTSSAAASASTTSTTTASPTTACTPTGSRTCASIGGRRRSSTTSARGAEAYLQMWERADGVQRPAAARRSARRRSAAWRARGSARRRRRC